MCSTMPRLCHALDAIWQWPIRKFALALPSELQIFNGFFCECSQFSVLRSVLSRQKHLQINSSMLGVAESVQISDLVVWKGGCFLQLSQLERPSLSVPKFVRHGQFS